MAPMELSKEKLSFGGFVAQLVVTADPSNSTSIAELDLSHKLDFTPENVGGFHTMLSWFAKQSNITACNSSCNHFTLESIKILECFHSSAITALDVSSCTFEDGLGQSICNLLGQTELTYLNVGNADLLATGNGRFTAADIAATISNNDCLTSLQMSSCHRIRNESKPASIGIESLEGVRHLCAAFAATLASNCTLTSLQLANNFVGVDKNTANKIAHAIASSSVLTECNISSNFIFAGKRLADGVGFSKVLFRSPSLEYLDISKNSLLDFPTEGEQLSGDSAKI